MTSGQDQAPQAKDEVPDPALPVEEQERLALLKILELAERNIEDGKTVPLAVAMKRFRARILEYARSDSSIC